MIDPEPKSQKEISKALRPAPYNGTDINDLEVRNRATELSFRGDNNKLFSLGIKDIDEAIMYYFDEVINPIVIQNGESLKVPIVYSNAEKWKSYQADGFYRDNKGKIMSPIISIKRNSIEKERNIGNKMDANNPRNYGLSSNSYNSNNRYGAFNTLRNRIPVKQYYATVIPDYIILKYNCVMFTYLLAQMNKLIEAVNYASDSYWGDPEKFKFITRIDSFSSPIEMSDNDERIVKSEFEITVRGHIVPDIIQKDINSIKKLNSGKIEIEFLAEQVFDLNGNKT